MNRVIIFLIMVMGLSFVANSQGNVDIEMVFVQGGTFTMGCIPEMGDECEDWEKPAPEITLIDYYIGKYEVTQEQWEAVMGENNNLSKFKGDSLPVTNIGWKDVQEFINRLNTKTGKNYRLPTEAEWEYAARGGNKSKGYKYSGSNNVNDVAWFLKNSDYKPHPVGRKLSNELDIYDMSGNVCEWCSDGDGKYKNSSQTNPKVPSSGFNHVGRGGSWRFSAGGVFVVGRLFSSSDDGSSYIGFRLAHSSE